MFYFVWVVNLASVKKKKNSKVLNLVHYLIKCLDEYLHPTSKQIIQHIVFKKISWLDQAFILF